MRDADKIAAVAFVCFVTLVFFTAIIAAASLKVGP